MAGLGPRRQWPPKPETQMACANNDLGRGSKRSCLFFILFAESAAINPTSVESPEPWCHLAV